MFAGDASRVASLTRMVRVDDCELFVDFSKQRIDAAALAELVDAAGDAGVFDMVGRMVAGEVVNATERRAATHMAMRAGSEKTATRALLDEAAVLDRELRATVDAVPDSVTHVINLGIGGSDLGPALLCDALAAMRPPLRTVRFASNVDPLDLDRAIAGCDPRNTLFVVCSKTFGTIETLANARRAAAWLRAGGVDDARAHMIAVTSEAPRVAESGLPIGRVLGFPTSVGGRFSVSSSVSLSVALGYGIGAFEQVRDGMRLIDEHFVAAAPSDNVPLLVGLMWWWNSAVLGHSSIAVVPYSAALGLLPAYLQQLVMESNGKSVDHEGRPVATSSPVVLGGTGTNAQHAFFQMLHQGTQIVPCDFIGHSSALGSSAGDHDTLVANMFAQSAALAFGVTADEVGGDEGLRAHRATPGDRPSTTILVSRLTPRTLGALIALYEHATVVQGVMFGVNSFDQWGVELGKQLAGRVVRSINGTATGDSDASTTRLVEHHRQWRNRL
jgi:glucose-6-phosphate isomerase